MNSSQSNPQLKAKPAVKQVRLKKRRGNKAEQEVPWELKCVCGETLLGKRTRRAQTAACPNCDRPHFILPINVYPKPKVRKKRKKRAQPIWKDGLDLVRSGQKFAARQFVLLASQIKRRLIAGALSIRAWFTPLRLAAIGLTVTIAVTGLLSWRNIRYQAAIQTLRESAEQGKVELDQENWVAAGDAFAQAAAAIAVLDREDAFAAEILQKDRELQAISQLCTLTVEEIIEQAADGKGLANSWKTTFEVSVRGRWLIMECWVDPSSNPTVNLANPLPLEQGLVDIVWPAGLLNKNDASVDAVHVLAAGRIEQISRSPNRADLWLVTIEPTSAFLWCFPETVAAIGFELESPWLPQNSLKTVLQRQRQQLLVERQR